MSPPAAIDIHLFALKPDCAAIDPSSPRSPESTRLDVCDADMRPFDVSMETLGEILAAQPRCYFEWDGSFVWTGDENGVTWTLSGMIYDTGQQISRVELRGTAPLEPVHRIVGWLSIPPRELACQQILSGTFISGLELERLFRA